MDNFIKINLISDRLVLFRLLSSPDPKVVELAQERLYELDTGVFDLAEI